MFPVNVIGAPPAADRMVDIKNISGDGATAQWSVPEETPVAFVYNRRNYAVMLATPNDLVDFAVGFSLSERVIQSPSEIIDIDIIFSEAGADLRIRISDDVLSRFDLIQRRRNLPGQAGCGLCGLENADHLFEKLPRVADERVALNKNIVSMAFSNLSSLQLLNERTRTVHGAGWVGHDGEILMVREDVGRHNALDKLLGALAVAGTDIESGFVVVSSRCSYELVEKAARSGVKALASISGPTGFALKKAGEANMALYARGPDGVVEIDTG